MKFLGLFSLLVLCIVGLVAMVPSYASSTASSEAYLSAGTQADAEATPVPERDRYFRSYPAPTGEPGFRKYYQKRCYPGCHYGDAIVTPEAVAPEHKIDTGPERPRYYRSYPAPTGEPGFRKYYQKRCYPGCHYGDPVAVPEEASDTHELVEAVPTRERYYRSYPAPTGEPGFRKYYQKRCYPGCHYSGDVATPGPAVVHP